MREAIGRFLRPGTELAFVPSHTDPNYALIVRFFSRSQQRYNHQRCCVFSYGVLLTRWTGTRYKTKVMVSKDTLDMLYERMLLPLRVVSKSFLRSITLFSQKLVCSYVYNPFNVREFKARYGEGRNIK